MSLFKPSKTKIGTALIFIVFIFLNAAMQSIPKNIYKEEVKKYYSLKGASPEIIQSREKYVTEAYAQLKTPSISEAEKLKNLGYLNITIQFQSLFFLHIYLHASFIAQDLQLMHNNRFKSFAALTRDRLKSGPKLT